MALSKTSRRYTGIQQLRPQAFRVDLPSEAPPEIIQAWRELGETGSLSARNKLIEFFLPLVRMAAARKMSRNPSFFGNDLDLLISDGVLGLIEAINQFPNLVYRDFRLLAYRRISRSVQRNASSRMGLGVHGSKWMSIVQQARQRLTQELGRVPDRFEVLSALKGQISNPNIYLETSRHVSVSQMTNPIERREVFQFPDSSAGQPERRMMERETIQLALKGLRGDDRELFKRLIRGDSIRSIARDRGVSLSSLHRRANGLLWEARTRADLAEHFAVAPLDPAVVPKPRQICRRKSGWRPRTLRPLASGRLDRSSGGLAPQLVAIGAKRPILPKLDKMHRDDASLMLLLRKGYSQRVLRDATVGKWKTIRLRISALQKQLLAELAAEPARKIA